MSGVHGLLGLQAPNTLFSFAGGAAHALRSAPIQKCIRLHGESSVGTSEWCLNGAFSAVEKKIQQSSTLELESATPAFPALDNHAPWCGAASMRF